jgi:rhodanese-related sulfurtransferase
VFFCIVNHLETLFLQFKIFKMEDLTQEEWVEQLENDTNAVILDVRTDAEVAQGKIPNTIHIDIYRGQDFVSEIEKLDKSKNYYVYCRSGNRSGQACRLMNQLGFNNAYNLMGGILQWQGDIE